MQETAMGGLWRDVRFGLRMLRANLGFAIVAVLALALGIGANTAIFSVVYATFLAPPPHPDADRLVMVWSKAGGERSMVSPADYLAWREQSAGVFQHLHAWIGTRLSVTLSDRPEMVGVTGLTPGFHTMVGTGFALGRDFRADDGEDGRPHVAILRHRFWREHFGADPAVLGRDIRVNRRPYTVVGVLAAGDADRSDDGVVLPLVLGADERDDHSRWLLVMGRLKPGVSLSQANSAMDVVARRIAADRPDPGTVWSVSVEPLRNNFLPRRTAMALWLLLGTVAFVLLIACANVANLMLARSITRAREIAVRASLGAGQRRLVRQLMTESLLLAVLGGVLGTALAVGLLHAILAVMPPDTLPLETDVRMSLPVLAFTVLASLVAAVLFGCLPAWQASRIDLNTVLKEQAPAAVGGRQRRLRSALVAGEFAIALTLLAGGGLALHGFVKLVNVDLGFEREHLLTFGLPVPTHRLPDAAHTEAFYRDLLGRVGAVPEVMSAAVSTGIPVYGMRFEGDFQIVGQPPADPAPGACMNMVSPDYFTTMGIRIQRGRAFDERDRAGSPRVAIVNEALARRYFAGQAPLGQRLRMVPMGAGPAAEPVDWEVIGVYGDVRNAGPRVALPEIDVPFWQNPWPAARVTVRTAGSQTAPRAAIADIVRSLDPDLPMADVKTMDQLVGQEVAADRFHAVLFGGFAGLALLLAVLGIYGAMSFAVAQRTHEIGVRMTLGAERGQVLRLVLREGLLTALVGWLLGLVGAYVVGRAMQGMWFEVGALDPSGLAAVSVLLMGSAVLACLVPARRAASVDPIAALRRP